MTKEMTGNCFQMLENVLQILGVDVDESGGEEQLMTECTSKMWSSLQVCFEI